MPVHKKLFTAFCDHCHRTVAVQTIEGYSHWDEHTHAPPVSYHLCSCPDCHRPVVMGVEHLSGDVDDDWQVFPSLTRLDRSVPEKTRVSFEEALQCLRARAFTATAIMCRRAIEAACDHFGERKGTLHKKLQSLHANGVLDQRLFEWADALRGIGNDAAHDAEYVASHEEAKDAIEFTRALIETLFVIEGRFRAFKGRRAPTDASAGQAGSTPAPPLPPTVSDDPSGGNESSAA